MAEPIIGFNENDARNLLNIINGDPPLIQRDDDRNNYVRFYRFTMTGDFVSGVASATITQMDGTSYLSNGQLKPGMAAFEELASGDTGQCFYQDGYFWVSNADCPA